MHIRIPLPPTVLSPGMPLDIDSTVMNNHIKLFVNEYTLDLGINGREAINELFRIAREKEVIPPLPGRIFLTDPCSIFPFRKC